MKRFLQAVNKFFFTYRFILPVGSGYDYESEKRKLNDYIYCMGTLRDSTQAIDDYKATLEVKNQSLKYLLLLGVLQAIIIQQDSIRELSSIFLGFDKQKDFKRNDYPTWHELRDIRDAMAGHPTSPTRLSHWRHYVNHLAASDNESGPIRRYGKASAESFITANLSEYESELIGAFRLIANALYEREEKIERDFRHEPYVYDKDL